MTISDELKAQIDSQYREFRDRLLLLADRYINDALRKRCEPEDILQDTIATALAKPEYFTSHPEVPPFFKWRTLLFHTISDTERAHLQCRKRNADCEIPFSQVFGNSTPNTDLLDRLQKSVSNPRSKIEQLERAELLMRSIAGLSDEEQHVITLRQFDRCTAPECAELLGMTLKQVNACHIRALRHLRKALADCSGFQM